MKENKVIIILSVLAAMTIISYLSIHSFIFADLYTAEYSKDSTIYLFIIGSDDIKSDTYANSGIVMNDDEFNRRTNSQFLLIFLLRFANFIGHLIVLLAKLLQLLLQFLVIAFKILESVHAEIARMSVNKQNGTVYLIGISKNRRIHERRRQGSIPAAVGIKRTFVKSARSLVIIVIVFYIEGSICRKRINHTVIKLMVAIFVNPA